MNTVHVGMSESWQIEIASGIQMPEEFFCCLLKSQNQLKGEQQGLLAQDVESPDFIPCGLGSRQAFQFESSMRLCKNKKPSFIGLTPHIHLWWREIPQPPNPTPANVLWFC